MVQSVQETSLPRALNRKYLKNTILTFGKTLELKKQLIIVLLPLTQKIADEKL
jgi:hypothetical protein